MIGAEGYERTVDRLPERNGTHSKLLATKAGDRRYLSEESMALIKDTVDTGDQAAIESGE